MPRSSHLAVFVRLVLVGLTMLAIVVGFAGLATYLVERRAAALVGGSLEFTRLGYNPFSSQLTLDDVRARNGDGTAVFTAERVTARLAAGALFGGAMALDRLRVVSPTLRLTAAPMNVVELVSDTPATLGRLPVMLDDVAINDGVVVIDGAGRDATPIVIRHIDARFGRVAAASLDRGAFAIAMQAYGSTVAIRGQPVQGPAAGYVIRVRGEGLHLAQLVHDFVPDAATIITGPAAADVEAQLLLSDGHMTLSGHLRSGPVVIDPSADGTLPVQVDALTIVVERFDPLTWTGRISRLALRAPRLQLTRNADGGVRIPSLHPSLRAALRGLGFRRFNATDGTVALMDANGQPEFRIAGVQVNAKWSERASGPRPIDLTVSGNIGGGSVSLAGGLDFDRGVGQATMKLQRLPVAMWRRALRRFDGPTEGWLFFDGAVALDLGEAMSRARVKGRVSLLAPAFEAGNGRREDLRSESIVVDVRPEPALGDARVTITATPVRGAPLTFARLFPLGARVRGLGVELGALVGAVEDAARDARRLLDASPSPF